MGRRESERRRGEERRGEERRGERGFVFFGKGKGQGERGGRAEVVLCCVVSRKDSTLDGSKG